LGVICYRAPRLDPIKVEIEQIRSIFNRSHSTKVVLLLADGNINQILGRRLRGKLDGLSPGITSRRTKFKSMELTAASAIGPSLVAVRGGWLRFGRLFAGRLDRPLGRAGEVT
jgi:hypothetical protein